MRDTAPSCRLAVLLAAACRKAIIFRHGPAKQTRLIAWDRATDTFEPGQWMKGTRVYDERSAISPDGEHLLLFLGTFRPPFQTYTVLSRPPYYTALALWPKGDTWGGGGTFAGPRDIVLDHGDDALAPGFALPGGFRVALDGTGIARLLESRQPSAPWQKREQDEGWIRRGGGGLSLLAREVPVKGYLSRIDYALASATREVPFTGARWVDYDTNGDILFAVGGTLYRLLRDHIAESLACGDTALGARKLEDFSEMRFEPVVAPYSPARMLDEPAQLSPRLDRVTKEDRRRRARERKASRRIAGEN